MPARYGCGRDGRPVGAGVLRESGGAGDADGIGRWVLLHGDEVACRHERRRLIGQLDEGERPGADRLLAERVIRQGVDRHVAQEVRRGERLGEGLQEATEGRLQREDHAVRPAGTDRDLVPRGRRGPGIRRILERLDREQHVVARDGLAVMPARVVAQVDRPGLAVLSTDQRSARSGTIVPSGPLRMRPENSRATRSRSTWVRAVSGVTDDGAPSAPSTYGRVTGAGPLPPGADASGEVEEDSWRAGTPMRAATSASTRTRVPTTNVSVRVMRLRWGAPRVARGRCRQAVVLGARMYDASEKTTNRTRRTIVNCHSRRSTPRRLR